MSRHIIPAYSDRFEVIVGWDRPLNSFFAQVLDRQMTDTAEDPVVVWVGTDHSEIPRAENLQQHIARYAVITRNILTTLDADRFAMLDRGDSRLQREMRATTDRG